MKTETPWEVVYLYLLEAHRGRLTRGFASIQTELLTVQTGLRRSELMKALKAMQAENVIIIHQADDTAVDLAVTAVGMGRYISRGAS